MVNETRELFGLILYNEEALIKAGMVVIPGTFKVAFKNHYDSSPPFPPPNIVEVTKT